MAFTGNDCKYCGTKTLECNEVWTKDKKGYSHYCSTACKFRAIGIVGYIKDMFNKICFNVKVIVVGMDKARGQRVENGIVVSEVKSQVDKGIKNIGILYGSAHLADYRKQFKILGFK